VYREDVEILALAALDLGPDFVIGSDEDDIRLGAGLVFELLDPVVVGIALPGHDPQFLRREGAA
jgi:hypothetical protein